MVFTLSKQERQFLLKKYIDKGLSLNAAKNMIDKIRKELKDVHEINKFERRKQEAINRLIIEEYGKKPLMDDFI